MPTDHALSGGNGSNLSEDDSHDGYSSSLESEGMDLDELEQMNVDEGDDGAVTSVWDGRAKSARAWEREWAHFVSFFEEYAEVLMDGARDAGDYLVVSSCFTRPLIQENRSPHQLRHSMRLLVMAKRRDPWLFGRTRHRERLPHLLVVVEKLLLTQARRRNALRSHGKLNRSEADLTRDWHLGVLEDPEGR